MQWLVKVRDAENQSLAKRGRYLALKADAVPAGLTHFGSSPILVADNGKSWKVTLWRKKNENGVCSHRYGCYTIAYSDPPAVLKCSDPRCDDELMPH